MQSACHREGRGARGCVQWLVALVASTCLSVAMTEVASAQTALNVASGSDLVNALTTVSTNPGTSYRINFTSNVTLNASTTLPAINTTSPLIISGNNNTLDGGGVQRGFFIYSGIVSISDLSITRAQALGGAGGSGLGAGGGGLGAGGALFVASSGNVTVSNVQLMSSNAAGGPAVVFQEPGQEAVVA
jgi:hypothetical protein